MSDNSFSKLANKVLSNANTTPTKNVFSLYDINFTLFFNDIYNAGFLKMFDENFLLSFYDNILFRLDYDNNDLKSLGLDFENFDYNKECVDVINNLEKYKNNYEEIINLIKTKDNFLKKLLFVNYLNLYYLIYNIYKYNGLEDINETDLINNDNHNIIKIIQNQTENNYFIIKRMTNEFINTLNSQILSTEEDDELYNHNMVFYTLILPQLISINNLNIVSTDDVNQEKNALYILMLTLQSAFYNKYIFQLQYHKLNDLKIKFNECLLKLSDIFNKYIQEKKIEMSFEKRSYIESYNINDSETEMYIITYNFDTQKVSLRFQKLYKIVDVTLTDPAYKAVIKSEEINNFKNDLETEIAKML